MLCNGADNPQELSIPVGGSGPLSNMWFPWLTQVSFPNGILIGSAVSAGLTNMTNTQNDRQTHTQTD